MHWYIRHTVDLEKPSTDRDSYTSPLYLMLPGDNAAHVWQVSVYAGGDPVDLTGQTVQAFFTRPDGVTVALPGTVQGNTAAVTLARDVYLCRGEVRALMCLGDRVTVETDPALTLKEATFCVKAGVTNLTDPETVFPTISGLAEDLATLEGTVTNQTARIDALTNTVVNTSWTKLANGSNISDGSSTMGPLQGIHYRVEDGHHVYVHANVALSFTYDQNTHTALTAVGAIPKDLRFSSGRVHALGCANGDYMCAKAYVDSTGTLRLQSMWNENGAVTIPTAISWTDIMIEYFI